MRLKRNVVANYLGQGWSVLMGLAFLPLYIRYLGMEAYGLIGLFVTIQTWMTLLDLGLTPTLSREMARFTAGAHEAQGIRNLLRTAELVCFGIATVVGIVLWSTAAAVAHLWLRAQSLSIELVREAVAIMAIIVALRFCESIYRGSLLGLQRQVAFNVLSAGSATLRHAGAAMVLSFWSPTITAFFRWEALVSVVSLVAFAICVHRSLPSTNVRARFDLAAIRQVRGFAGGMMGITVLAVMLTHVDKLLLSGLLPLDAFGRYMLASTVAGGLYALITPITQAIYPRMVQLIEWGDEATLVELYHLSAQIVTVVTAPVALLLCFDGRGLLWLWTGDAKLATEVAPLLAVLTTGSLLNAFMWIPYQCQLAHGWTSFALRVNFVAVVLMVPALLWIAPRYGALGAAWMWAALNAVYVLVSIQLMHTRLLPGEKWRWYRSDLALPVAGAAGLILLARGARPTGDDPLLRIVYFGAVLASASCASIALADQLRKRLSVELRRKRAGLNA